MSEIRRADLAHEVLVIPASRRLLPVAAEVAPIAGVLRRTWVQQLAVLGLVGSAVAIGSLVAVPPGVRAVVVTLHLSCLVVGLGGVLTVDFRGLLWLLGRIDRVEVLALAARTHLQVWVGYLGLVVTGAFLAPSFTALTWTKLAATVLVGCNGVIFADRMRHGVPRTSTLLLCAVVSQSGWWLAMVIGHWNAVH